MTSFRATDGILSWGGVHRGAHRLAAPGWRDELPELLAVGRDTDMPLLAAGLRRSYGDSGLNPGGGLIDMTGLDRFISFDAAARRLTAEAGVSFDAILRLILPHGLFLPVTPGTRFVTLGGAIANDVHGKNHHRAGTLGRWVRRLHLLRSDGREIELSPADDTGLFAASIGGLGLTGIITRAEIELKPVASAHIDSETIPFANLEEFFVLARDSEQGFEYTAAWIDCLASGSSLGRGVFIRGNHAADGPLTPVPDTPTLAVPMALPDITLSRHSVRAFNALYHWRKARHRRGTVPLAAFFYPLDGIAQWNRIYGHRGFYQYQSVVPPATQQEATHEMLAAIAASGQGSFLAVLKTFGDLPSPGLLSFPLAGTTLALDFPNQGEATLTLLARLDAIARSAGGRLYPAKDGRMPSGMFKAGYPAWEDFVSHVDPGMSSSFWRRVSND